MQFFGGIPSFGYGQNCWISLWWCPAKEGFSVGLEGAAVQAVCTRQAMLPGLFSGGPSSIPHLYEWGVGDGQGSLACYSPWGHEESDMTELYGPAKQIHSSRFKIFSVNHVENACSTAIRFHFFKRQDSINAVAHKSRESL